jgi:hypothetical protein
MTESGLPRAGQPRVAMSRYPYPPVQPPRPVSTTLKVVLISLAAFFALGASGVVSAFIWARSYAMQPTGADSPAKAAEKFVRTFYVMQNPVEARDSVCPQARDDKAIAAQIDEVRKFMASGGQPKLTYHTPQLVEQRSDTAVLRVELDFNAAGMKASTQTLTLDAVNDKGWWICSVRPQ